MVLSIHLSEPNFYKFELLIDGEPRSAFVPAAIVNRCGPPKVYSHYYSGSTRIELLRGAKCWEAVAEQKEDPKSADGLRMMAAGMRKAVEFFDKVGWLNVIENFTDK